MEFLTYKGMTRYKFYKETGLSNGFLDKRGAVTSDNCSKICEHFPEINPEWLFTGKGKMIKNSYEIENVSYEVSDNYNTYEKKSIEILLDKIIELSTENTLLKKENQNLKGKIDLNQTS
jgi:hypothetical protein